MGRNASELFISMPTKIAKMATMETTIEEVTMANEVRPDTIFESINKMTDLVIGHRKSKIPRTQNLDVSTQNLLAT